MMVSPKIVIAALLLVVKFLVVKCDADLYNNGMTLEEVEGTDGLTERLRLSDHKSKTDYERDANLYLGSAGSQWSARNLHEHEEETIDHDEEDHECTCHEDKEQKQLHRLNRKENHEERKEMRHNHTSEHMHKKRNLAGKAAKGGKDTEHGNAKASKKEEGTKAHKEEHPTPMPSESHASNSTSASPSPGPEMPSDPTHHPPRTKTAKRDAKSGKKSKSDKGGHSKEPSNKPSSPPHSHSMSHSMSLPHPSSKSEKQSMPKSGKSKGSKLAKSGSKSCKCPPTSAPMALRAHMEAYPGYTGIIQPTGSVMVTFPQENMLRFAFDFEDLEPDCTDCGVHIHTGTTCDVADEVGGHYYSVAVDPWTTEGGAVYNADMNGEAMGYFMLTSGYDTFEENVGHAVVIHGQDGTRLSCGILMGMEQI